MQPQTQSFLYACSLDSEAVYASRYSESPEDISCLKGSIAIKSLSSSIQVTNQHL